MRALAFVILATGATMAADKQTELKALEGTWRLEAATLDGRDHTEDFAGMTLILQGETYVIDFAENSDKGTFTINPALSPKWIDIKTGEKGPFKGLTLPGIYKLEGNQLVLCLHADGTKRPAEFDARQKTRTMLLTYKRPKK
jgi:uncharacterized protein (TIGR03067 family)